MRRGSAIISGLILAVIATAVALGIIEVGVRALHLVPSRFWEPDALLGTRLVPNKEGWWTQEELEFRVPIRINSRGWRDVEHALAKPAGVRRVLVLGDSFIEAMQVPLEAAFARQLERQLNNKIGDGGYEVISLGVSGYGTASQLLAYRELGRAYAPDVVVLAFYPGNDVRNNSPRLEPVLRPVYDADGLLQRVVGGGRRRAARAEGRRGLLAYSQAYAYVRKLLLTQYPVLSQRLAGAGLIELDALHQVPMRDGVPVDYWVYARTPAPEWEEAWRYSERLLSEFKQTVETDGAELVIAIVTAREVVYPENWAQIVAAYPAMRNVAWDLDGAEARVKRWCANTAVQCIQLSSVFREQAPSAPRLHYVYDGHWTSAGHALAARAVAAALMERSQVSRQHEQPSGNTGH